VPHPTGVERIALERLRQITEEGWSAFHDDRHTDKSLAWAAVCYAAPDNVYVVDGGGPCITFSDPWPWGAEWDKRYPKDPMFGSSAAEMLEHRISELTKAGALIAAEIDRLARFRATLDES